MGNTPYIFTGLLFSSKFGTSSMASRYVDNVGTVREASEVDLILCNMFARKVVLEEVGGFDGRQVPCEENDLCYRISKRGYKLLYSPNIIVWHELRPFPQRFAKRVFNYATGRGVLISRYPDMLNVVFIVPSIFVVGLVLGPLLSFFFPILWYPFFLTLLIYFLVSLYYSFRVYSNEGDKRLLALLPAGFLICHLSYGLGFLYGVYAFLTGEWKRKRLWE